MRYVVVEILSQLDGPKDPAIKVFAGRQRAVEFTNESPNGCRIFRFDSNGNPTEIEATLLTNPEKV